MGQIEKVVKLTREIESQLDQLGASGRGLHEKITSIEQDLGEALVNKLRWIATLRNKIMHEHGFKIDNMEDYKRESSMVIRQLKNMYKPIKLREMLKPKKKEGCFIATAVYGSYDCPEVFVLRKFRDERLMSNGTGRLFVRIYYALSPTLASRIKRNTFLSKAIRSILDKVVQRLD